MQLLHSDEPASERRESPEKPEDSSTFSDSLDSVTDDSAALDVTGKSVEFPEAENAEDSVESLYVYKNIYSLIPKSVSRLAQLRTLKFFGNEINLFAPEVGNLTALECLQMKISSPGIGGLPLHSLQGLKELELSKGPPRTSAFPILTEISGLQCLTKLSICHFSIRYLPPEIGCLKKLEYLDLSFNKMKTLPVEISYLSGLISMKVANNKLMELPSAISSLSRLESLDLSNNKLTSLGSLELASMHRLKKLNLQCFTWRGRIEGAFVHPRAKYSSMISFAGCQHISSTMLTSSSSSSRCFVSRKSGKRWKRRYYLQQKARQERLNNSRKWKAVDHDQLLSKKIHKISEPGNCDSLDSETRSEIVSENGNLDNSKRIFSEQAINDNEVDNVNNDEVIIEKRFSGEDCCTTESKDEKDACLCSIENKQSEQDEVSCFELLECVSKSKRHLDRDLDNPKPCKSRKSISTCSSLSNKYSKISFCGIEDHLSDGFYDAGRDRPFFPLERYEQNQKRDEELDAVLLAAQALVHNLNQLNGLNRHGNQDVVDNLRRASLLALFVSDHFGGSDRGAIIEQTRKSVSGSNYNKPFICTCSVGSSTSIRASTEPVVNTIEDITLSKICEKSLDSIKKRRNSIIVPIGSVQYGVCRHRALLFKYLCDHMEPPIPCELVRGYLDFSPHAWNIVMIKRGAKWVRMLIDACRPLDIREEKDTEYFCRYIPLNRTTIPLSSRGTPDSDYSIPSLTACDELETKASTTLIKCKIGSVEAAAKVRTLADQGSSADKIKNFEYNCLGEIRILGALKHPCIVEMYGHKMSCQWSVSADGNPEHRVLRSAIFMEYVEGGSLKNYLEKLSETGKTYVPVELALHVAKDVSCALSELHSRHIIHRDIKSENILLDLDRKRDNGAPTVKLCDFDSAVPLRSTLHACCIAHVGTPPPCVCVGTPRWMAPEVMQTISLTIGPGPLILKLTDFGKGYSVYVNMDIFAVPFPPFVVLKGASAHEADIWSFGCLLLEMLTLQIPYSGLSDSHFLDSLQMGKRPQLTDELEALSSMDEPSMIPSGEEIEKSDLEVDMLKFLVDLFHKCVEENPNKRPTAEEIHKMLLAHTHKDRLQLDLFRIVNVEMNMSSNHSSIEPISANFENSMKAKNGNIFLALDAAKLALHGVVMFCYIGITEEIETPKNQMEHAFFKSNADHLLCLRATLFSCKLGAYIHCGP
ncbi:LRR receptor-like serine/threonine-protein [Vigna angularis]|uniref:LRR receptor-like serine/threonine-protein n=1 Tax=Phaseolus angularis TaxID=3914 RepID=A0A8T0KUG8_PHAAN|nr:LRR receptor-like serine/threonine-protein [Vigna angularis]